MPEERDNISGYVQPRYVDLFEEQYARETDEDGLRA